MSNGKFATSISCMDGRIQFPINQWIKENYSVDYVDTITEPGVDKKVAEDINLELLKSKTLISVNIHKSGLIVISGHYDCAGNPVSNEMHISQIKKGVQVINSWNLGVKVMGVWVDENWKINLV